MNPIGLLFYVHTTLSRVVRARIDVFRVELVPMLNPSPVRGAWRFLVVMQLKAFPETWRGRWGEALAWGDFRFVWREFRRLVVNVVCLRAGGLGSVRQALRHAQDQLLLDRLFERELPAEEEEIEREEEARYLRTLKRNARDAAWLRVRPS